MSNSKAVPRLRAIELSGDFSQKAASGAVSVQDPIRSFLDRLLDGGLFECAVIVAKKGLLSRKDQTAWPLVIASADDAKSARADLERIARAGFQLIVGTKCSLRDLETVFEALGYKKAGQGTYAGGGEHDPVQVAWEKEGFLRAVAVATKLCDHALCVFAHDGDPVYLLAEQQDALGLGSARESSNGQMRYSDSEIALAARQRIAQVFGMLADSVHPEHIFGEDLKNSGRSDFKYNEYDQMLHDIRDVADRQSLKEIDSGALEIRTVAEYCDHMVRCYRTNEKAVLSALGLPRRN